MNMSQDLPCEKIYPLFLMYNMEGNLGAFGWVFQGRPDNLYSESGTGWFHLTPVTYPVSQNFVNWHGNVKCDMTFIRGSNSVIQLVLIVSW